MAPKLIDRSNGLWILAVVLHVSLYDILNRIKRNCEGYVIKT